jgi:hypothetical protein
MTEPVAGTPARWRDVSGNDRRLLILVALVIVARSAVFVFWEGSDFDADQAVFGLMAKHLSELRALPIFMYGQNYMLAVEAWLAAPLFLLAGPSVTALKLPLLAINCAVGVLLARSLVKEAGLRAGAAALACVFFALPPPGTAAKLLEASGGTLEPLFYVVLLWVMRRRPVWCGVILGLGCLNREFTIYGFIALAVIEAARRTDGNRAALRRILTTACIAGVIWAGGQFAARWGSVEGPRTSWSALPPSAEHVEVVHRLCLDWRAVPIGYLDIARIHWPLIFGTERLPLRSFDIESDIVQGVPVAGLLLGAAMLLAALRIVQGIARDRRWLRDYDFCAYLVLVAALSVTGYVVGRCGVISPATIRYDMLSLLGAVGLGAWFLRVEYARWVKVVWVAIVVFWAATGAVAHARLWFEYVDHEPVGGKRRMVTALEARGIRYAISDYPSAYPIAFLSGERIIVSSANRVRIRSYEEEVRAHLSEAVRIQHRPCQDGSEVLPGFYFCPASIR